MPNEFKIKNGFFSEGNSNITGSLTVTEGITGSLFGTASYATTALTASYFGGSITNALSASYADTASYATTALTASYYGGSVLSASYADTASYVGPTLTQDLTINGNLTVNGTASYTYVTASQFDVGTNTISVNVAEPAERFGGLLVYDSGSLSHEATASLLWDSLNNHWIYQNASGSTYSGGMLMAGPRNTGSLGDEPSLTRWFVARSDGGDHLNNTQIFSSGSIHIVTGSLTVTAGVTGSLLGTASYATTAGSTSAVAGTTNYISKFTSGTAIGNSQIFDNGTNVGIGTTSPSELLDVQKAGTVAVRVYNTSSTADAYFDAKNSTGDAFFGINATGQYLYTSNNIPTLFYNSGSERMRIDSSGNVGIGTTSPLYKLDVNASSTSDGLRVGVGGASRFIITGDGVATWGPSANVGILTWDTGKAIVIGQPGQALSLGANGFYDQLYIDTLGNVGIGTTNPATKLNIQTTSNSDQELLRLTVTPADSSGAKPKSILGFYTPAETNTVNYPSGRITSKFDVAGYANSRVTIESLDSGGNFIETLTAKNGNVGIGTTSPGAKLDVVGSTRITGSLSVTGSFSTQINDNAFGYNTVFSNTNAGSSALSGLVLSNASQNPVAIFQQNSNGDLGIFNSATTGKINLFTNSTTRMTIDDAGNVGIGSPPTNFQRLDVSAGHITTYDSSAKEGKITFNNGVGGVRWDQLNAKLHLIANSADAVTVLASGDVGIGNTSPLYKLDVNGGGNYSNGLVITGSLRGDVSALSIFSNTASVNMAANNFFNLTLVDGANTHISPVGIRPGQTVNIRIRQGAAGTGTVSFPSFVDQASGSLYTGSMVSSAFDIITMITFDTSVVYLSSIRNMI